MGLPIAMPIIWRSRLHLDLLFREKIARSRFSDAVAKIWLLVWVFGDDHTTTATET
jgi:hypothetical protein